MTKTIVLWLRQTSKSISKKNTNLYTKTSYFDWFSQVRLSSDVDEILKTYYLLRKLSM